MHAYKMKGFNKNNNAPINEQLLAEKNFSESILANIREPLLVLDESLKVITANKAFYKLFKVDEKETLGVRIYDIGNTNWDLPELQTLLEKIIPDQTVIEDFQVSHNFPKIGELTLKVNARQVKCDHTSKKLILLSIEDITEKQKSKDLREKYTRELEDQIKARTIELRNANHELTLKNEHLIKMNTELEAFAYVSSHDLQEPLRKIRTLASRLIDVEKDNLSEKGHFYFNMMQDSAGRMQTLISDLLSFSKLNNVERKFENTDLNVLIKEVQTNLSCVIEEQNATIEVSEFCEVDVIVFQFKQLITNLITNALKFSKPGVSPRIVIDCENKKGRDLELKSLIPNIEYCHITVSDNGIGFEEEFNEKIFEVFQRLHQREDYPGTGIGLATVRKIVNNHSGKIRASGKVGKGSTFEIYLPVINSPENTDSVNCSSSTQS